MFRWGIRPVRYWAASLPVVLSICLISGSSFLVFAQDVPAQESPVLLPAHVSTMQPTSTSPIISADTVIPVGTTFRAALTSPLSSRESYAGDQFQLVLDQDLASPDGHGVIPAGSLINARVQEVKDSKLARIKAQMAIQFYEIITPDGQLITIDGSVDSNSGYLKGNKRKGKLVTFAVNQVVKTGVTLAAGAAVGFGTGIVLMTVGQRGQDVILEQGDSIGIRLNRAVYFSAMPTGQPVTPTTVNAPDPSGIVPVSDTASPRHN